MQLRKKKKIYTETRNWHVANKRIILQTVLNHFLFCNEWNILTFNIGSFLMKSQTSVWNIIKRNVKLCKLWKFKQINYFPWSKTHLRFIRLLNIYYTSQSFYLKDSLAWLHWNVPFSYPKSRNDCYIDMQFFALSSLHRKTSFDLVFHPSGNFPSRLHPYVKSIIQWMFKLKGVHV